MKHLFILPIFILLFSCKKEATNNNQTPISSQWVIDNITYKVSSVQNIDKSEIIASDGLGDNLIIDFGGTIQSNYDYTVIAAPNIDFVASHCDIQITTKEGRYFSTGMGGYLITTSSNGITITMTNIYIMNLVTSKITTLSGTIIIP